MQDPRAPALLRQQALYLARATEGSPPRSHLAQVHDALINFVDLDLLRELSKRGERGGGAGGRQAPLRLHRRLLEDWWALGEDGSTWQWRGALDGQMDPPASAARDVASTIASLQRVRHVVKQALRDQNNTPVPPESGNHVSLSNAANGKDSGPTSVEGAMSHDSGYPNDGAGRAEQAVQRVANVGGAGDAEAQAFGKWQQPQHSPDGGTASHVLGGNEQASDAAGAPHLPTPPLKQLLEAFLADVQSELWRKPTPFLWSTPSGPGLDHDNSPFSYSRSSPEEDQGQGRLGGSSNGAEGTAFSIEPSGEAGQLSEMPLFTWSDEAPATRVSAQGGSRSGGQTASGDYENRLQRASVQFLDDVVWQGCVQAGRGLSQHRQLRRKVRQRRGASPEYPSPRHGLLDTGTTATDSSHVGTNSARSQLPGARPEVPGRGRGVEGDGTSLRWGVAGVGPSPAERRIGVEFRRLLGEGQLEAGLQLSGVSFLVAFKYGSLVIISNDEALVATIVDNANALREGDRKRGRRKDGPGVREPADEQLPLEYDKAEELVLLPGAALEGEDEFCRMQADSLLLRFSDLTCLRICAAVLAQSVALDNIDTEFAKTMEASEKLNQEILSKGTARVTSVDLERQLARIHVTKTGVISRLEVFARDQAAWRHHRYDELLQLESILGYLERILPKRPSAVRRDQTMKEEFEIDQRLRNLDSKLTLVTESAKHLLELHHNQRSESLEKIIIMLIAIEIVIGLIHFFEPPKLVAVLSTDDKARTALY